MPARRDPTPLGLDQDGPVMALELVQAEDAATGRPRQHERDHCVALVRFGYHVAKARADGTTPNQSVSAASPRSTPRSRPSTSASLGSSTIDSGSDGRQSARCVWPAPVLAARRLGQRDSPGHGLRPQPGHGGLAFDRERRADPSEELGRKSNPRDRPADHRRSRACPAARCRCNPQTAGVVCRTH